LQHGVDDEADRVRQGDCPEPRATHERRVDAEVRELGEQERGARGQRERRTDDDRQDRTDDDRDDDDGGTEGPVDDVAERERHPDDENSGRGDEAEADVDEADMGNEPVGEQDGADEPGECDCSKNPHGCLWM
jgi:hypothetical protein